MIVNEVSFGESSSGAAVAHGSFIAQGATHARMGGAYGNRNQGESREQTIANATQRIQKIATVLRLSDMVCLVATRMYTLAVEHKFTKGRKGMNVAAVCLYVACRQKETRNYMLIDFSDLLQVNVFELGHIYLQLVQTLGLRLPLVDPSHYISRYAGLLEFGDETHKVATDAVRLVQRFDRDWMTRGRRPAGICGAALILAARMNNFRRSIEEIVQVVKIADTTVKKRLDEFKMTPSANLTLADFRSVMLEEEMDPPAFTKGKEKDLELDGSDEESSKKGKRKKKSRKGKRKRVESDEDNEIAASVVPTDEEAAAHDRIPIDPALLNEGILASTSSDAPVVDSSLPEQSTLPVSQPEFINAAGPSSLPASTLPSEDPVESTFSSLLAEEVSTVLQNDTRASQVHSALDEAEERRLAEFAAGDDLTGLDEDELDAFLLTEEEVKIKERVWVELNKDYLEALAAKGDHLDHQKPSSKSRKRQKNNKNPRDASTPQGATAAESVRNMMQTNPTKYSKRINYNALKDLFVDVGQSTATGDDEDTYMMDADKTDSTEMIVIEEDASSGPLPKPPQPEEDDYDYGSDKEEGVDSWEDAYEQEV